MPHETRRGITKGILQVIALVLSIWAVAAGAQDVGPATVTVQVDLDAQTQQLLAEAEALIGRGQNDRAFELLSAREVELAGNPLYDYLLGIAALDSGRYGEAIFSLQRTLDVQPGFSGARMALARAHYQAGEKVQARSLFLQLLDEQPPDAVGQVVNQYLAAIDRRPKPKSRFTPFIETIVGHDTNANASTASQNFLGFMLTPNSVETNSAFTEVGAGFDWVRKSGPRSVWFARMHARHRDNPDASFVNATTVSGQAAMAWRNETFHGRLGIDGYWGARDGDYNEKYAGVNFELGRPIGNSWDITTNVRYGEQRYEDSIDILDVDRLLYSVGLARPVMGDARVKLELIGGDDSVREAGSPYGNSKVGGRISISAPVTRNARMFGSIGYLETDYDGMFFGAPRKDEQMTAMLQLEFRDVLAAGLSITPRVLYIDNDSDVGLYAYDRTEVGVLIRWSPK